MFTGNSAPLRELSCTPSARSSSSPPTLCTAPRVSPLTHPTPHGPRKRSPALAPMNSCFFLSSVLASTIHDFKKPNHLRRRILAVGWPRLPPVVGIDGDDVSGGLSVEEATEGVQRPGTMRHGSSEKRNSLLSCKRSLTPRSSKP